MTAAQKALLDIYGPYMDFTHTRAFMAGWNAALEFAAKEAEAFRREDNGDDSRWSIYNQGRADALESISQPNE